MEVRLVGHCEVDEFLKHIQNSPCLRNLAVLTFRFVSSPVFDELVRILMDIMNHRKRSK